MNRSFLSGAIALVAVALTACQSDPNYATGPAGQPILAPTVGTPPPYGAPTYTKPIYSKTKSSTWTSPDGRNSVTKTKSTSASVSVDTNALMAGVIGATQVAPGQIPGGYPVGIPGADGAAGVYSGTWQLTDGDNYRNCAIDLKPELSFGTYRAWTRGCFTTDLFQVGKWQLRGHEVVLLDFSGKPQASLRPTGPNRFDGYIVADGQPISMWR